MGFDAGPGEPSGMTRQEILERLSRGEIEIQEATRLLTEMGKHLAS
jgi:hypothetical protein